jgi:hypothetical protein
VRGVYCIGVCYVDRVTVYHLRECVVERKKERKKERKRERDTCESRDLTGLCFI